MAKKFENKKLNKDDHAKVDKQAGVARGVAEGVGALAIVGVAIKKVPWKRIVDIASKVIFRS